MINEIEKQVLKDADHILSGLAEHNQTSFELSAIHLANTFKNMIMKRHEDSIEVKKQELENLLATSIADGGGQMFVDNIDQCCGRTIDHVSDQDELIGDAGTMYDIVVDAFYTAHGLPGGFSF